MTDEQTSLVDELRQSFADLDDTETIEATADTEEHVDDDTPDVEATEDSTDGEPEQVFQPPEHWSSDLREQFSSLTPEAQEVLLARDKEFQKGYQEKAQAISAISQAIEPWKEVLAQRGITPDQAIRTLFAAQHALETKPLDGILQLAQNFGVMDQLQKRFVPDTDDDFADPEVKALKAQIEDLKNQVNQTQEGFKTQQTQSVQEQIIQFKSAVDENGNPKHAYFDKVKHLMAPLVGQGKSLEQAYSEVVWSVPEFRESQLKKPTDDVDKARKVKQAKRASRSIKQDGKANAKEADDPISIGDDLRLAWKQHTA